ncbi:MAG: hypothetical protein HQK53_14120 [Oligoflexia bacterium]|nr:hypothetical protein [Oligoflexia bacterium]
MRSFKRSLKNSVFSFLQSLIIFITCVALLTPLAFAADDTGESELPAVSGKKRPRGLSEEELQIESSSRFSKALKRESDLSPKNIEDEAQDKAITRAIARVKTRVMAKIKNAHGAAAASAPSASGAAPNTDLKSLFRRMCDLVEFYQEATGVEYIYESQFNQKEGAYLHQWKSMF